MADRAENNKVPTRNAPNSDQEPQRSRGPDDRPTPPHRDEMNRKTAPGRDSAAPSSPAPVANHGGMARIAEAWDRSTAPGATSRSTISSASIRLQRLRLACRSGAQLIPILATRYGWARPGHACLWTDILNPL